jgi:putative ABC transport system permease protein
MRHVFPSLIDVRCAIRALAASPGFAAVAALTLALGIGANSAVFSILNEVFLRPIPLVPHQDRLVALGRTLDGRDWQGFTHPDYLEYRARSRAFDGLTAFRDADMNLTCGGEVQRIRATLVSGNYFSVLEVKAALGRTFLAEEDRTEGTHPVAIVSHALWARCFVSDPGVLGKTLVLNGAGFTVVGIAPEGFVGTELDESPDLWIPLMMEAQARPLFPVLNNRLFHSLKVVGRLSSGIGIDQAQAEMRVLSRALEQVDGRTKRQREVTLSPNVRFTEPEWRAWARQILGLLMAVAGVVLVIACSNVANLLLARLSARRREIAVRFALGASRLQVIRRFLIESVLLALLGGALGVFIGLAMTRLAQSFLGALRFRLGLTVLGFTFLLSLLTAIIMGLAPALQGSRASLVPALKDGVTETGFRSSRVRRLLVVLQVALSLMVIIGAGLFLRTVSNLQRIDLGFEARHLLVVPLDLRPQGYPDSRVQSLQRQAVERLQALPGVEFVSLAGEMPVSGFLARTREILIDGRGWADIKVDEDRVGTRYFETLGVPIRRGRGFSDSDRNGSPLVAVISESMARRFWPGEDPIGKRVRISQFMSWSPSHEVVGVVADTRYRRLEHSITPHLYVPLSQNPEVSVTLLARTSIDPSRLLREIRREVAGLDPSLPLPRIMTLADHLRDSDAGQRLVATFVGLFAVLALVLSSVGVYSLMSYTVAQQRREIGVRMALGAARGDVVRLVIGEALLLALAGVGAGLAGAFVCNSAIASQLYDVSAVDPLTFVCASALLPVVALVAAWLPARRAVRVDPMAALREE